MKHRDGNDRHLKDPAIRELNNEPSRVRQLIHLTNRTHLLQKPQITPSPLHRVHRHDDTSSLTITARMTSSTGSTSGSS